MLLHIKWTKKKVWLLVAIVMVATGVSVYLYLTQPVEIVIKNMKSDCNPDGRHFTIIDVFDGPEKHKGKLVLPEGEIWQGMQENPNGIDTVTEYRVVGNYSLFAHGEAPEGCNRAHSFKIKQIVSISKLTR